MFADLKIFQMSGKMAQHAGARQSVIAKNIANADVPRYKVRDIPEFKSMWRDMASTDMRLTRASHHAARAALEAFPESIVEASVGDPNGNTVSVETELMKVAKTKLQHDMALQVYSSSMKILRTSLGRQ